MKRIKRKQPENIDIRDLVSKTVALHQRGRLDEAEALYREALERSPNDADLLHFHGVLLHQRGRSTEAIKSIRRALRIEPNYIDAHNNLGNVLKELGRLREATREYRQVLALDETNAGAHNNLATSLRRLEQFEESITEYKHALELEPGNAEIWVNFGNALRANDQTQEALTAFRKAIEIKPMHAEAHLSLGRALHFNGRTDEAAVVYRKWLERQPENPVAKHMLASTTGIDVPDRASDEYIRATFNGFASSFDSKLEGLGYRGPEQISSALDDELGSATASRDILDAGCGTGLCGPLIRHHAKSLVGVDLSERMLDRARNRGVYDELVRAELTSFMAGKARSYDVVVSADTLIYFGALDQFFEAAAHALRPGGTLIFSVEDAGDEDRGLRLNAHGRFSHTRDYIRRTLEGAGMSVSRIDSQVLRREVRIDVAGLIVTASNRS